MIHTTDQDWIREADTYPESAPLAENILFLLTDNAPVANEDMSMGDLKALFR